jgi:hypothetical protein
MLTQLTYVLLRIDSIESETHMASNQRVENIKYVNGGKAREHRHLHINGDNLEKLDM